MLFDKLFIIMQEFNEKFMHMSKIVVITTCY